MERRIQVRPLDPESFSEFGSVITDADDLEIVDLKVPLQLEP